jgi:uncharacterized phiE125 gp8 family phage protein
MLSSEAAAAPPEAVAEAKALLRVALADEDDLIAALMAAAVELCEQFTRQVMLARVFTETLCAAPQWQRLSATPVRSISGVEALTVDGSAVALGPEAYAIDIDANGDGWVRVTAPGAARRVRVAYQAGLAAEWSKLPEALRHGTLRLAAFLYAHRDAGAEAGPPAAVTALWRPWRRMRLG